MRNPPMVIVGFPGNQPIRFGSVLDITAAAAAHPNVGFGAIILFKTFQTIIVESDNQIMRINFSTFFSAYFRRCITHNCHLFSLQQIFKQIFGPAFFQSLMNFCRHHYPFVVYSPIKHILGNRQKTFKLIKAAVPICQKPVNHTLGLFNLAAFQQTGKPDQPKMAEVTLPGKARMAYKIKMFQQKVRTAICFPHCRHQIGIIPVNTTF